MLRARPLPPDRGLVVKRWMMVTLAVLGVGVAGFGLGYREYVVEDPFPQFMRAAILAIIAQESPVFYRDWATRIDVLFDVEHRAYVLYAEIPLVLANALVAVEDG